MAIPAFSRLTTCLVQCSRGKNVRVVMSGGALPRIQIRRNIASYTSPYQAAKLSVIRSVVDTNSAGFQENAKNMAELVEKLGSLHRAAALGGSAKAREKHAARGKMLVRE